MARSRCPCLMLLLQRHRLWCCNNLALVLKSKKVLHEACEVHNILVR